MIAPLPGGSAIHVGRRIFEWVTSIVPRRTPSGEVAQHTYDQPAERLNRYGAGPFCRFGFPADRPFGGVYLLTVDGQVAYVGECKNLSIRFGPLGYGHITARNCLRNGQSTNCRINAAILEECLAGRVVEVWFLRTRRRRRIEEDLRGLLQPPWNRQRDPRRTRAEGGGRQAPTAEGLRTALREMLDEAAAPGDAALRVRASDLQRRAGGRPGSDRRLAACCRVMHAEAGPGDAVLVSPPSGLGASLTIEYRLPRDKDHA